MSITVTVTIKSFKLDLNSSIDRLDEAFELLLIPFIESLILAQDERWRRA